MAIRAYDTNERLWAAEGNGDAATTKATLAQGADPEHSADGSVTAMYLARKSQDRATIRAILAAKPDVNGLLYEAIRRRNIGCARFLIAHGAAGNAPSADGSRPLQYALGFGDHDRISFLKQAASRL